MATAASFARFSASVKKWAKSIIPRRDEHAFSEALWSSHWKLAQPRIRVRWKDFTEEKAHAGRMTAAESLWIVIITMGVAGMRDEILAGDQSDIEWYVLHFFVIWAPVRASITYSSRFNDHDLWHQILWGAFTVAMTLQIADLNHSLHGFAGASAALHLLIGIAHVRVALLLPEAKFFCCFHAAASLTYVALLSTLAFFATRLEAVERPILWVQLLLDPLFTATWRATVMHTELRSLSEYVRTRPPHISVSSLLFHSHQVSQSQPGQHAVQGEQHGRGRQALVGLLSGYGCGSSSEAARPPSRQATGSFIKQSTTLDVIEHRAQSWDIPVDREYIVKKFEGMHMMILVCSFLFPLGLQGSKFVASAGAAISVLLGISFALMLKLAMMDVELNRLRPLLDVSQQHSRALADTFMLAFPCGMLGIALTGVGFVGSVCTAYGCRVLSPAARELVCIGPALTWATLGVSDALLSPERRVARAPRQLMLAACVLAFLLPLALDFGRWETLLTAVGVQAGLLFGQLFLSAGGNSLRHWRCSRPKTLVGDDRRTRVHDGEGGVSSGEHFFTVLVAVGVFSLNESLLLRRDVIAYVLNFFALYAVLGSTMRYAARYEARDGAHRYLWAAFLFGFVLVLQGLNADFASGASLYKCALAGQFLLMAFAFRARAAYFLPDYRAAILESVLVDVALAAIILASVFTDAVFLAMALFAALTMLAEPVLELLKQTCPKGKGVRISLTYFAERLNGLHMEVLGVAIIVPNAQSPSLFAHPHLVFACVVLAALLAVCVKVAVFDVAPVRPERHALRVSPWRGVAFLSLHPLTALSVCLLGGSTAIIIRVVGSHGLHARTPFAQRVLCLAAALFWASLALTRLSHLSKMKQPMAPTVDFVGAGAMLLVCVLLPLLGDFAALAMVVSGSLGVVLAQLVFEARPRASSNMLIEEEDSTDLL